MAEVPQFGKLTAAIRDTLCWLRGHKVRGAVIGGIAASLLGQPRFTKDVDLLIAIDDSQWENLLSNLGKFGLSGRIPDVMDFARQSRVLLLQHDPTGVPVDVAMGALDFEEELIKRAKTVSLGRLRVPVPRPEDLIILKAVAQREQDLADIVRILQVQPKLDLSRIREKVAEFAAILEQPEILEKLEDLLLRRKKGWKS